MPLVELFRSRAHYCLPRVVTAGWAVFVVVALAAGNSFAAFSDLVVFGDSLSDIGNIADATFGTQPGPYYYEDRFSNGPVYSELLAADLGMPTLTASTASGNDFAYGGAQTTGTGGLEGFFIKDVDEQVTQFVNERSGNADTLYVMFAGANDLINGQTDMSIPTSSLANDIGRLIDDGARTFLIPNLPHLGTVPRYNTDPVLSAAMNSATDDYNAALASALDTLETTRPEATFIRFDTAALFEQLQNDPASFGFANVTESAAPGLSPGDTSYDTGQIVADPSTYLFWDDLHPTTAGHAVLAELIAEAVLAAEATPGDANMDGKVDGLDYLIWAGHYGDNPAADPPGAPANGDFNGDTVVDGLDYLLWAGNYGQGPLDAVSVPEPTTAAMSSLFLAVFVFAQCFRRK